MRSEHFLAALAAACCTCSVQAQAGLSLRTGPTGWLELVQGDRVLLSGGLACHGPDWSFCSQQQATQVKHSDAGAISGRLALPAGCQGDLTFTQSIPEPDPRPCVGYRTTLSHSTKLWGLYVSLYLPAKQVAGRRVRLFPSRRELPLPEQTSTLQAGGPAEALALELEDSQHLFILLDEPTDVRVIDGRQWDGNSFELRFYLLGRCEAPAGLELGRRLSFQLARADGAAALEELLPTARPVDPNRPAILADAKGVVTLRLSRDERYATIRAGAHGPAWEPSQQDEGTIHSTGGAGDRSFWGRFPVRGNAEGAHMLLLEHVHGRGEETSFSYKFTSPAVVRLNSCYVSLFLHVEAYAGKEVFLEGDPALRLTLPREQHDEEIATAQVSGLKIAPGDARQLALALARPALLRIQDNRQFHCDVYEFRFSPFRGATGLELAPGASASIAWTLRTAAPHQLLLDADARPVPTDTTDWFPFTLPWDAAPVDLSFLNERPAGKRGFLQVRGEEFAFEDGTAARFWGTCVSAHANFPPKEIAPKIARRMARFGVNIVRTHHADAGWINSNLFRKDRSRKGTRQLDPEMLDRFDYFVYCLKQEGIYIYLDQLVTRIFEEEDGVASAADIGPGAKAYSNFDPRLIELQKEFTRKLLTHVNPYTELAYKDEPAVVLLEFANENDLLAQKVTVEPYRTNLETKYRAWAKANGVTLGEEPVDFRTASSSKTAFLAQLQKDFYLDMRRWVRDEIGARMPVTGSNWSINAALLWALAPCDYTDSHAYWDHPHGDRLRNNSMTTGRGNFYPWLAFQRVVGKPFFVSEWDQPWPNDWRAETQLLTAAVAALQGWGGATVYTYRHSWDTSCDSLSGAFETFNDPCRFGLFPHAALIFRRGDVAPARRKLAVRVPAERILAKDSLRPWSAGVWPGTTEKHAVATLLGDADAGGWEEISLDDRPVPEDQVEITSDTGQLKRNWQEGYGMIDTPRTQAVYGFVGGRGALALSDLSVEVNTPFAVVAISSLSNAPIRSSTDLLLTAVARAENTGFAFNLDRTCTLSRGVGPILTEPVRARIRVRTANRRLRVAATGPGGQELAPVRSSWKDGFLEFDIGPACRSIYYRLR